MMSKTSEAVKRWRLAHPEQNAFKRRDEYKKIYRALKIAVLSAYGALTCSCCRERHLEFLTLDHINGGGGKARTQVGGGVSLWRGLKKQGFPDKEKYRVLCMNCNLAFGRSGYCPHVVSGSSTPPGMAG